MRKTQLPSNRYGKSVLCYGQMFSSIRMLLTANLLTILHVLVYSFLFITKQMCPNFSQGTRTHLTGRRKKQTVVQDSSVKLHIRIPGLSIA